MNETKNKDNFIESYKSEETEYFEISDKIEYQELKLPHWFLTVDEWALLLQASEKTQQPILRSALGFTLINDESKFNHIVATAVLYTVSLQENSAAKGQRMFSLLSQYGRGGLNGALLNKHSFNSQFGSFQNTQQLSANTNQENFINEVKNFLIEDFQVPSYYPGASIFTFDYGVPRS